MLNGLLLARNRITHEVDQVGYLLATAKGLDGFAANWTWQYLPPRSAIGKPIGTATTNRRSRGATSSLR